LHCSSHAPPLLELDDEEELEDDELEEDEFEELLELEEELEDDELLDEELEVLEPPPSTSRLTSVGK